MNDYPFTSLVTLTLVGLDLVLASRVSTARFNFSNSGQPSAAQHSVEIYPDPHLMASFRNQMNLLEHLILFLPTLWIFAFGVSDGTAATVGLGYFVDRVLYARNYLNSHRVGYTLAGMAMLVLLVGAAASIGYQLITLII